MNNSYRIVFESYQSDRKVLVSIVSALAENGVVSGCSAGFSAHKILRDTQKTQIVLKANKQPKPSTRVTNIIVTQGCIQSRSRPELDAKNDFISSSLGRHQRRKCWAGALEIAPQQCTHVQEEVLQHSARMAATVLLRAPAMHATHVRASLRFALDWYSSQRHKIISGRDARRLFIYSSLRVSVQWKR